MTKLVVLLVLGFSSLASAATVDIRSANAKNMRADKDRGGGNAVNGQLFDFYENEGTETVDVTKLTAYTEVLAPLFKKLDAKIPALSAYLTTSLTEKEWFLEPKPLSAAGCVNSSMIKVQTTIIACQSPYEVRIDSNWLTDKNTTLEQAAGLIMHELLVAKMMKPADSPSLQIREESVRYLNRLFFSQELPDALKLQEILHERNFKVLSTASEVKIVKTAVLNEFAKLCPASTDKVPFWDAQNAVDKILHYSMSGRFTRGERKGLLLFASNFFARLPGYDGGPFVPCRALHSAARAYDGKAFSN